MRITSCEMVHRRMASEPEAVYERSASSTRCLHACIACMQASRDLLPCSEQEAVYERILDSPDYQQLLHANAPCLHCDSGLPMKECHALHPELAGILSQQKHPDGEACSSCPFCIMLPALTYLNKVMGSRDACMHACPFCIMLPALTYLTKVMGSRDACMHARPSCIMLPTLTYLTKVANHLELLKPDERLLRQGDAGRAQHAKQDSFARMLGDLRACRRHVTSPRLHARQAGRLRAHGAQRARRRAHAA